MDDLSTKKYETEPAATACCNAEKNNQDYRPGLQPLTIVMAKPGVDDAPCCGPKPGPPSSPQERPGYRMLLFVDDFVETAVGAVPRVKTSLEFPDIAGTFRARLGFSRDRYRIAPGLYCVGAPGSASPVLVSANYKLSFDSLRRELAGIDAWILVVDTRGVNVWCAAGKRNFSTDEVIRRVKQVSLDTLVSHRNLILPQLGAPGVSAHEVKKGCGFRVIWGPIRASDLKIFIQNGCKAEGAMRQLTFTTRERMVLIPVELSLIVKPSIAILLAVFLLSGISPGVFSFSAAWSRGLNGAAAYVLGVMAGAVAVPIFLPWLPVRQFYLKGIMTGLVGAILMILSLGDSITGLESLTLLLLTTAVSSYAAMNFTGATPFTSPSGVEKEMRRGIPIQIGCVAVSAISWVAAPFIG
jgi:hypothetical protein